jgi:dTDP-glucose pyrophosphorylase
MDIADYLVKSDDGIQKVIDVINRNRCGIALVVDGAGRLLGTITDGDIRRYMLSGADFQESCARVMHTKPVTAMQDATRQEVLDLIRSRRIRSLPLVDPQGRPVRLVDIHDLLVDGESEAIAVVMAGGQGKRLWPLTQNCPKPMLELGGKPLLESTIDNLKRAGIKEVFLAVNYMAQVIEDHFGDGSDFGVRIKYLREKKPLGTAGALSLLEQVPTCSILVMNGDLVTDVNLARLVEFHKQHRCVMTVAATAYHLNIPLGVFDLAAHYILGVDEKPSRKFMCNAGIYAVEPEVIRMVPQDVRCDMTDVLKDLIHRGLPVTAFAIHEDWVDIGSKADLERVQRDLGTETRLCPIPADARPMEQGE